MENRNNMFRRKHFFTIDRLLIRLATIAVILLVVVQALLLNAEARKYLSLVDKLEGEQITSPSTMYVADISRVDPNKTMTAIDRVIAKSIRTLRSGHTITIRMITPAANSDGLLTINGEVIDNFARGKVELTVYDGDYIEIDVTKLARPAQFIIDTHKSDMIAPLDGILLESKSNIIIVGKVIFKR